MPPENSGKSYRLPSAGITDGKLTRVPNSPRTPHHSFRIPQDLYERALGTARAIEEPLTDIVREALQAFIDAHADDDVVRKYFESRYELESGGDGQS